MLRRTLARRCVITKSGVAGSGSRATAQVSTEPAPAGGRAPPPRRIAWLRSWNFQKGFGFAQDIYSNDTVIVHHSSVAGQTSQRRGLSPNQVIEYSQDSNKAAEVTGVNGAPLKYGARHGAYDGAGYDAY
ncbi:hypothetical protein DIPPA_26926 [Diplonema papillatum]|nr:hypothetical protein DIPPA_26926 [Diplonema papillatum]